MCNLTVVVVLDFISRDLYLLFAIRFSSKFQNSVFYQHMRPKSGLKFPRPFLSKTSLRRGKGCVRFWARSDQNRFPLQQIAPIDLQSEKH